MNFPISEVEKQIIVKFYEKLYETMLVENKLKEDSIILSFLKLKSNVRHMLLEKSSISNEEIINAVILKSLKRNHFIRDSEEVNKFILTAKGVWLVENERKKISLAKIITFLDEKFFDLSLKEKGLTEKEKIILFSMIAARTFSKESPIDLKKDDYVLNSWKDIIDKTFSFLKELKVIKKIDQEHLYGKKGNEHIVSNLIRHTDSLPKKVKRLFCAPGDQKYYLDFYKNNNLSIEALVFIFKAIFGSSDFSLNDLNKINHFCREIAYDKAPYIHNIGKHIFASPKYDDIISDALEKALFL